MRIAIGGEYAAVRAPRFGAPLPREWKRGDVQQFSARSRSRMIQSIAQIDARELADRSFFITLTYPRNWRHDAPSWKRDLEVWGKRVTRKYPNAFVYWKLEFQQRGAPHFHLLLFGPNRLDAYWFHQQWYEIIGSTDKYHWRYGTDVKPLLGWKQVSRYCSKYCAKVDENIASGSPGRFWGVKNRAARPANVVEVAITEDELWKVRRVFKAVLHLPKGYHAPGGSRSGVWCRVTNADAKRVLEWASGEVESRASPSGIIAAAPPFDGDRPSRDNDWSSRDDSTAAQRMKSDGTMSKPTSPLFDRADLQRRAARRVLS